MMESCCFMPVLENLTSGATITISFVRNDNNETICSSLTTTQPLDELVKRKLTSITSQCFLLHYQLMHPADQVVSTEASKFTASVDIE